MHEAYLASGKTYVELSRLCGIDRRHISDIVNGVRKTILPSTLGRLAKVFDVSINDLYIKDEKELVLNMVVRKLKRLTEDELEYIDDCIVNILGERRRRQNV